MTLKVIKTGRPIKGKSLTNSSLVYEAMRFLGKEDRENFYVLHLNGKNRIIAKELVSIGSLTSSTVHPREVFKGAILNNSGSIICVHNHPSGDPVPSREDITITERLRKTRKIVGIPILDHVIIGEGNYMSVMERPHFDRRKPAEVAEKTTRKKKRAVKKTAHSDHDSELDGIIDILKNKLPDQKDYVLGFLLGRLSKLRS